MYLAREINLSFVFNNVLWWDFSNSIKVCVASFEFVVKKFFLEDAKIITNM